MTTAQLRKEIRAELIERRDIGPLEDRAKLGVMRFTKLTRTPGTLFDIPMDVKTKITPNVLFGEGTPSEGERIMGALNDFYVHVEEVLTTFRPYL